MNGHFQKWDLINASIVHCGLILVLFFANSCSHTPTFIQPPVTMVTAISTPLKQTSAMPNRPTKAKVPKEKSSEPKPDKPKVESKPDPKPDALQHQKEEPEEVLPPDEEDEETPDVEEPNNDDEREALIRELARENLLDDFTAIEGDVDRPPTALDGTDSPTLGQLGSGNADPELAAYIQRCRNALIKNWTPLPTLLETHPEFQVTIEVNVNAEGKMTNPRILLSSGDNSFDQAAIMAVHKTGSLPAPPDKWKDSASAGVQITLAAADK